MQLAALALAGLAAGGIHVLSGPDHLAAVTPLSMSVRRGATRIGLLWGLGHAAGLAVIGVAVFSFRGYFDLDVVSVWSERAVGLMLIAVGIWGLRKAFSKWFHTHEHKHGPNTHTHIHCHHPDQHSVDKAHNHSHATLAIGLLHGVAGTTHLFGLLPALALPNTQAAVCYLCGYGLGNFLAMGGFACLVGSSSNRLHRWGPRPFEIAMSTCSVIPIAVGCVWLAP